MHNHAGGSHFKITASNLKWFLHAARQSYCASLVNTRWPISLNQYLLDEWIE